MPIHYCDASIGMQALGLGFRVGGYKVPGLNHQPLGRTYQINHFRVPRKSKWNHLGGVYFPDLREGLNYRFWGSRIWGFGLARVGCMQGCRV